MTSNGRVQAQTKSVFRDHYPCATADTQRQLAAEGAAIFRPTLAQNAVFRGFQQVPTHTP